MGRAPPESRALRGDAVEGSGRRRLGKKIGKTRKKNLKKMDEKDIKTSFLFNSASGRLQLEPGTYICAEKLFRYIHRAMSTFPKPDSDEKVAQIIIEDCDFVIPADMCGFGFCNRDAFFDLDPLQELRIKVSIINCTTRSYVHDITIKA